MFFFLQSSNRRINMNPKTMRRLKTFWSPTTTGCDWWNPYLPYGRKQPSHEKKKLNEIYMSYDENLFWGILRWSLAWKLSFPESLILWNKMFPHAENLCEAPLGITKLKTKNGSLFWEKILKKGKIILMIPLYVISNTLYLIYAYLTFFDGIIEVSRIQLQVSRNRISINHISLNSIDLQKLLSSVTLG